MVGVPGFFFLSWDTEGNIPTKLNLLQAVMTQHPEQLLRIYRPMKQASAGD
jgi:hypothetical protein